MVDDEPLVDMHVAVRFGLLTLKWPRLRVGRERLVVSVLGFPLFRATRSDVESLVFKRGRAPVRIDSITTVLKQRSRRPRLYVYPASTESTFADLATLGWPCEWEDVPDAA
jgi:hypothetical protein